MPPGAWDEQLELDGAPLEFAAVMLGEVDEHPAHASRMPTRFERTPRPFSWRPFDWPLVALAADAVVVGIEVVRVGMLDHSESSERNRGAVEVRRWRWNADVGVRGMAVTERAGRYRRQGSGRPRRFRRVARRPEAATGGAGVDLGGLQPLSEIGVFRRELVDSLGRALQHQRLVGTHPAHADLSQRASIPVLLRPIGRTTQLDRHPVGQGSQRGRRL